jgi:tetratricopeptide (TPR) repeat protein
MDGGTPLVLSSGTDTHLEQLRTLKREFDQLSHQGHLKEALECREAFAEVEKAYYLSPARDVANSILALNSVAIKTLSEGDADGAKEVLVKSMRLLQSSNLPDRARLELRAITLSNLSCYELKHGSAERSLSCLLKAFAIEGALYEEGGPANIVSTSMNLTVVLSNLGRHREALRQAEKSCQLLAKTRGTDAIDKVPIFNLAVGSGEHVALDSNIRCIAFYNLGVEQEHNKMPERAVASYRRAQKYTEKGSALEKMVEGAMQDLGGGDGGRGRR